MATKYVSKLNAVMKVGEIYIDYYNHGVNITPTFLILDIYKRGYSKKWTMKIQSMHTGQIMEAHACKFANSHKKA